MPISEVYTAVDWFIELWEVGRCRSTGMSVQPSI